MIGSRRAAGAAVTLGCAAASLVAGCTVGNGTGAVRGPIFLLGCSDNGADYGTPASPRDFDLSPTFFAGEPIEDVGLVGKPNNRLLIRIQRNGNRIEVNDTLYVDVQSTFEVARCLRGRTVGGVPDYDPRWCDWTGGVQGDAGFRVDPPQGGADGGDAAAVTDAGDAGGGGDAGDAGDAGSGGVIQTASRPRIYIATELVVRSSLSLLFTCHNANVIGLAVSGWIDFLDFGTAAQPDLPPELRDEVKQDVFTVNFGDRLRANLHIELGDQRVTTAIRRRDLLIPAPLIGGTIDGSFDFDLERGRAAQPFP
jgi:hypothetical protein